MDACERSGRISLRFVAIQFCNIFLQEGERWSSKRHVTFGCDSKNGYVVRVSDLVDLWVIMIKMPMILCAGTRSTSRSREQSTKRRSRSKNMQMVCLFYSQNNKIECLSTMTDTFSWGICAVRKGMWALCSWLCFLPDADWLGRETVITWL